MVLTRSTMMPLGSTAPDFELANVDGRIIARSDFDEHPVLLVMFLCNHCPYVIHIAPELARLACQYLPQGVAIVGINSNDTTQHPLDSPEQMVHEAENRGYVFPYLFDEEQTIAKRFRAACTPDFFLFDAERKLVYRGQLDSSRPQSDIPVTGHDLRMAMDAVLDGRPVAETQKPSIGCNIKWRAGHEPDYFAAARSE